jgi:hypothetical protein
MKISVIIPPLFSIASLKNILESISKQSYSHYEVIIIVASGIEVGHLADSFQNVSLRITVIQNTGESVNSISRAFFKSSGDLIWILDCVEEFSIEKLSLHVKLFSENPAIGGIRSGFIRKEADNAYRSLNTVQEAVNLENIFFGEPIHLSDVIFRREWVENFFSNESFSEPCSVFAFSLRFYAQTLLAGCLIIGLNQSISYRYKTSEENIDIKSVVESTIGCLDSIFTNPKTASPIAKWKDKAIAHAYLQCSIKALENKETELGQKLFRRSILLNRSILDIGAHAYFTILIRTAIQDGNAIDEFLTNNISQLSTEFAWMSHYLNESIARGYFYKAIDEIAFGRYDFANQSISKAHAYGMNLSQFDLIEALRILSNHEVVYGFDAIKPVVQKLAHLSTFVERKKLNWIITTWFINLAFTKYKENQFKAVPKRVISALLVSPGQIFNRGVFSIFFKSLFQMTKNI